MATNLGRAQPVPFNNEATRHHHIGGSISNASLFSPFPVGLTSINQPVIAGSMEALSILTASPGLWTGSPISYSYQWRSGTFTNQLPVGANLNTYTTVTEDIGNYISVVVTAMDPAGAVLGVSSGSFGPIIAASLNPMFFLVLDMSKAFIRLI